jgi:PAS domain-containing protein
MSPASRAMAEQVGIASLGIMPIMAGRMSLGFISISSKVPDAFDDRILYLYQNLAEQGAAALQSARLQDAVKESEERFRVLYENSPLGFILNDFDKGDYIAANNAFLAMMGYTLDELNQLSYWDLTPRNMKRTKPSRFAR